MKVCPILPPAMATSGRRLSSGGVYHCLIVSLIDFGRGGRNPRNVVYNKTFFFFVNKREYVVERRVFDCVCR